MQGGFIQRVTDELVSNNIIDSEDSELYTYGLQQGALMFLNILTILIVGKIFGMLWQSVVFMVTYIPLRTYAGGYHARTQWGCYISSVVLIVAVLLGIRFIPWTNFIIITISIILGLIIYILSPVEDSNKPLDAAEVKVYGKKARMILGSVGSSSTLSFSAVRNNVEGVVVSGHANDDGVGEAFRYLINSSSNEIGEVLDTNYGGKSDCAFVELESSSYDLSNDIANGSEFSSTSATYIYGLGCSTYGKTSNEDSGIITATSVTFTNTEGVTLSDMVRTDIERDLGDSGGPLYRATSSGSELLMGSLSSSTTNGPSSYSKINNIINDLDLDSIYTQ